MKKLSIIILVLFVAAFSFCSFVVYSIRHDFAFSRGTSIRVNENQRRYEFTAYYPSRLFNRVERYMDAQLRTDFFARAHYSEDVTLDDDTKLYVWNRPGKLIIKLKKEENSPEACLRIKKLTIGLKERLTN